MADISNKSLAVFLLIATVVSLGGFILSFSRLDSVGITGNAVADQGTSNFSINSSISVVFLNTGADFGPGLVNTSGLHNCTLNTTGPGMLNGASNPVNGIDCWGFFAAVQPLRVQNQGTQNVTLNVSFNNTGAAFVGGGSAAEFGYKATANESNSCGGLTTAYQPVAGANTNYTVCGNNRFNWVSGARTLNLDFGLRIPQDAPPGARAILITAYASNS